MKIAMMGAGALGSLFGGKLALAGEDVVPVGRGAHLAAMRDGGLVMELPDGTWRVDRIGATDDPASVGPVDVVMFLVKRYDTAEAARAMAPLLGEGTVVVTFQNGIGADRDIAAAADVAAVPGTALIPANVPRPGVVRGGLETPTLFFGAADGGHPPVLFDLAVRCERAGIAATVADDIADRLFSKFSFLSTFAAITALTRLPIGVIREDAEAERLLLEALAEAVAVARAARPSLPGDLFERHARAMRGLPPEVNASMADDLRAGKRIELDYLSGAVLGLGEDHDVPTPVHRMAYAALHPFLDGAPAREG